MRAHGGRVSTAPDTSGPTTWPWRVVATATVALAAASLVFEQSPANEAVRTNVALEALKRTESPVAVGLTVAAITVVIELASALLITAGLHQRSGAVQRLKRRMVDRATERSGDMVGADATPTSWIRTLGADTAIALGLGAGIVTLRRHVADPNPSVRQDVRVSLEATAMIAVVSGLIGYLLGGGIANADRVGLATPAGWVVDYGTDTRFWISVLAVGYLCVLVNRWVRTRHRRLHQPSVDHLPGVDRSMGRS